MGSRSSAPLPVAAENCKLKTAPVQVKKKLHQPEIVIDVQEKVSAVLGIALWAAGREEGDSLTAGTIVQACDALLREHLCGK